MRYPTPLIPGRLIRRYKRFLSDIELRSGEVVTAHCPNPGSMMGLAEPDMTVWLSESDNPSRKLRYSWELSDAGESLVGVNTGRANTIVGEALAEGRVAEVADYGQIRREVKYGRNSRIDFLLESEARPPCYLEVKSVTLRRGGEAAEFPDAVTARGAKHLDELADVVAGGGRAVMLYLVQRADCRGLSIADDIDPAYGRAWEQASARGVESICYGCNMGVEAIVLDKRLPLTDMASKARKHRLTRSDLKRPG